MTATMTTTALAGWYGSCRMLAHTVGKQLAGCKLVAVPFAGGMSELAHIKARTILVNDKHRHIITLARVAADPVLGPKLYRHLRRLAFHPDTLEKAQERCRLREAAQNNAELFNEGLNPSDFDLFQWAADYFVCCWMGRGGNAGTDAEFRGALSVRYNANGGDSNTRYHSAVSSLIAWRRVLSRCNFTTDDAFDFLARIKDESGIGLYLDPPWPDAGDKYTHKFDEGMQSRLAHLLRDYQRAKVVVRFGDHPLIRRLYPSLYWTWLEQTSRAQSNGDVAEALILNAAAANG